MDCIPNNRPFTSNLSIPRENNALRFESQLVSIVNSPVASGLSYPKKSFSG